MKQTTKTLLGLVVLLVVALAIGGVALRTGKEEAKKAEAKEKGEKLFDFDKAHARVLRLSKGGQLVVQVEKGDKGWQLTQPVQAPGDGAVIDPLLTALSNLRQKKAIEGEKDLKPFGLDKPAMEISVKLDDGKEETVQLGGDNPFDSTLYAKKQGDATVAVIDAFHKASFDKSAFDLRDKQVAKLPDGAEVKRVEVSAVSSPYTLEKDGAAWKVNGQAADNSTADAVANALKNLRATAVAAESSSKLSGFGLDKPSAVAKVTAGPETRTVRIGQSMGKTYAMRDDSPVVYEVAAQILTDIDKQPFDLENKQLFHVDREALRKAIFESSSGKVEIARAKPEKPDGGVAEEVFTVVAPKQGPARKWKTSSTMYAVSALRAAAFEGPVPAAKDLKKYGLDKPRAVTFLGDGDKVLLHLRVGAEKDGKRYALADGFDKLVLVDKGIVDDFPWNVSEALEPPPTPQASK
ncbi:MAG TPA: DUF4340 domain-containing protein [Myxococcales bacterium]